MKNFYNKHPLAVILLAGFLLRTAAAFYNYTPTAEDDYANVIEPALAHYQTGAPIQTEAYRLAFLPKVFYIFIQPLKIFGITSTPFLVSWGLFILGCFSLLGIWAFYRLGGEIGDEKNNMAKPAGWLYAAHFILPFFSTRAFQESLTLTTVPLALWFLLKKNARARDFLLGGAFLGLTVVFRFQVGILALTAFFIFAVYVFKKQITSKHLLGYITGGLLALFFLVSLDLMEGRAILSTPLEYIRINYEGNIASTSYGSAPWHTYITLLAAVFIPPFSLVLLYPFFAAFRKNLFLAINLVVFIALHSFIGNKLERFMLPVLPFFFLLTLHGLFALRETRIVRYAWRGFIVLNLLILLPVTLSRSQLNTIDAAAYLAHKPHNQKVILYRIDFWRQAYMSFAMPHPASVETLPTLKAQVDTTLQQPFYILSLGEFAQSELIMLKESGKTCTIEQHFEPSWQEKLVIYANPKFNARRDTTVLYYCSP